MGLNRLEHKFHAVPDHDYYGELRLNPKGRVCCLSPSQHACPSGYACPPGYDIDDFNHEKFLKDPKLISKNNPPEGTNLPGKYDFSGWWKCGL